MNEYTPSTEEVRARYVTDKRRVNETIEQHYLGVPIPDYGIEFDRWLTSHDAELRQSVLKEAWLAVHVTRFGAAWTHPDTYYAGVIHARNIIEELKIKEE